jgi:hypothetical protein
MNPWIATACGLAMTALCHGMRHRDDALGVLQWRHRGLIRRKQS